MSCTPSHSPALHFSPPLQPQYRVFYHRWNRNLSAAYKIPSLTMDIRPPNAICTKITGVATPQCCSLALRPLHRSSARPQCQRRGKRNLCAKAATSGQSNNGQGGSSMVDRDMLVLRKRMHQLRMEEMNHIPQQWMEWEKRWYPSYGSDVCDSLLWMQTMLLNTRPSIAMAVLALIFTSVGVSLLFLLMELITFISV